MSKQFDEKLYLVLYKDVANAIEVGEFKSAHDHYVKYGKQEGRVANYIDLQNQLKELSIQLKRDLQEKEEEISELRYLYSQIESSNSWRITRPLRGLRQLMTVHKRKEVQNKISRQDIESYEVKINPVSRIAPVVVVLPIYRNVQMTKDCIFAAMSAVVNTPNALMLAINDASPDEGMRQMLIDCGDIWPKHFVFLENEENLGFVRTVNRGLQAYQDADVVLLNSDVIVPSMWLSRLISEAYQAENIGTVTPFSNNATICSFPFFLEENQLFLGKNVNEIDEIFQKYPLPLIAAPTGVGFCMYIKRMCLNQIGELNYEKFGRGYGEENDLCQRAVKKGWLNVITSNIYAYHEGGASFSTEKQALINNAMKVLEELHPNYHVDVQKFVFSDPLREARIKRYIQCLYHFKTRVVLHISHGIGGGVDQNINEIVNVMDDIAHVLLTPNLSENSVVLSLGVNPSADKIVFEIPKDYNLLVKFLRLLGVGLVHIHHTLKLNTDVLSLMDDLAIPYIVTVHDFYWLNGNPTLTDKNGIYYDGDIDSIQNPLYPLPTSETPVLWRQKWVKLFRDASYVVFPSESTFGYFEKYYTIANYVICPHLEKARNISAPVSSIIKKDNYNIGILGAIGKEKGADFLEELALLSTKRKMNLDFKLIGYSYRPLSHIHATGKFDIEQIKSLIRNNDIDIVLFPARWPETYSYTLSFALDSGLPIIAPDIGAFSQRLSARANTLIFPYLIEPLELLLKCQDFIANMSNGIDCPAPTFVERFNYDKSFYTKTYCSLIKDMSKRDMNISLNGDEVNLLVNKLYKNDESWREPVVRVLWALHSNKFIRRIVSLVPLSIKSSVRRLLVKKPLGQILKH